MTIVQREDCHPFSKAPEHVVNDRLVHGDSSLHVVQRPDQAGQFNQRPVATAASSWKPAEVV